MIHKLPFGFLLLTFFSGQLWAQNIEIRIVRDKATLKRGSQMYADMLVRSDKPITITEISPRVDQGFDVTPEFNLPPMVQTTSKVISDCGEKDLI